MEQKANMRPQQLHQGPWGKNLDTLPLLVTWERLWGQPGGRRALPLASAEVQLWASYVFNLPEPQLPDL